MSHQGFFRTGRYPQNAMRSSPSPSTAPNNLYSPTMDPVDEYTISYSDVNPTSAVPRRSGAERIRPPPEESASSKESRIQQPRQPPARLQEIKNDEDTGRLNDQLITGLNSSANQPATPQGKGPSRGTLSSRQIRSTPSRETLPSSSIPSVHGSSFKAPDSYIRGSNDSQHHSYPRPFGSSYGAQGRDDRTRVYPNRPDSTPSSIPRYYRNDGIYKSTPLRMTVRPTSSDDEEPGEIIKSPNLKPEDPWRYDARADEEDHQFRYEGTISPPPTITAVRPSHTPRMRAYQPRVPEKIHPSLPSRLDPTVSSDDLSNGQMEQAPMTASREQVGISTSTTLSPRLPLVDPLPRRLNSEEDPRGRAVDLRSPVSDRASVEATVEVNAQGVAVEGPSLAGEENEEHREPEAKKAQVLSQSETSDHTSKQIIPKPLPFSISPGFSDHLAFFGQIDIAAIVKNSTKTASELKSDATMEDAAGLFAAQKRRIEDISNHLGSYTWKYEALKTIKNEALSDREDMTRQYQEAGAQLQVQAMSLQKMTRVMPSKKRRTGEVSRAGSTAAEMSV